MQRPKKPLIPHTGDIDLTGHEKQIYFITVNNSSFATLLPGGGKIDKADRSRSPPKLQIKKQRAFTKTSLRIDINEFNITSAQSCSPFGAGRQCSFTSRYARNRDYSISKNNL